MKNKVISMFGSNKVVQNKGVKYSELLEQFMTPFSNEFRDIEYIEDIFEFAINAWNFGNMQIITPNQEFEKSILSVQDKNDDINYSLLKKMVDYKVSNFKEYENFIVDYELKEVQVGEDPILSVITLEKEAYLANMMDVLDNEVTPNDFEENYINRSAIILKPLQPFVDWLNNLYPNDEIGDIREINTYLVADEIEDLETYLKKKFDKFFIMELEEWHTNKKEWPQKRNYKMFNLWFRVETSQLIYDLEKKPILKSE
ncbi:MAG: hypothetical protein ACI9J3_000446 [Parvicellaceae bacterium]|jgi:hypothetical protein